MSRFSPATSQDKAIMDTVETSVGHVQIDGTPSDDEIAAIVAAIEMSWPKPIAASATRPMPSTRWRHADRWWAAGRLPGSWR